MNLISLFVWIPMIAALLLPFFRNGKQRGLVLLFLGIQVSISAYFGIRTLTGIPMEIQFPGTIVTGAIPIRMDALSAWFILIIDLIFLVGITYGLAYLKSGPIESRRLNLHFISLLLQHASILAICVVQNSLVFLVFWELMALTSFLLIIYQHEESINIQAGINYLIQAHLSIVFLIIGFLWVAVKTGSYDFQSITNYASTLPPAGSLLLFLCFFAAFAIKAGLIPFHTWLPYAHPAAPSHISGMMSGILIKIGVYGIFRFILLIPTDYLLAGYLILFISVISGLYGVMMAIVQHNLKKLLAYHSIENIGIVGIGIAIG
ncbi:MAG: hypothetical protein LWW85_13730, partial [Marinilabiliales bacterium]|nr:hypothetical protein [Marinilabiliales bacterium]